jgi:thiol-disulfide isomerase/thioredoxin
MATGWLSLFTNPRRWTALLVVVTVLSLAWMLATRLPETQAGPTTTAVVKEGFAAPDFTLSALDGKPVALSSLRGRVVMVNLWATWCPPCVAEMPAIERVYARYNDAGFTVLAVNAAYQDDEATARAFAAERNLSFPILLDHEGLAASLYRLRALPTSIFIDRDGIIRAIVYGGPMSESAIEIRVKQLLTGGR